MRVLLIGAGASVSIKDVETGYHDALLAAGIDVKLYALDRRIGLASRWLRTLWRERGRVPDQQPTWPDAIYRAGVEALEMALRFEVDWVLAMSAMFLHPDVLVLMQRAGLKTAVLFTESPYDDDKQLKVAPLADVCWTNERSSVATLRHANPNTFYMRHAYDTVRHTPVAEVQADVPSHDVVFVGTGFQERIDVLSEVDWSGIDLGLYGFWDLLPSRHRLRKHLRANVVSNSTATALYRQAKIGLNLYRTSKDYSREPRHIEHAESMNPRAYELAACRVFQISDRRSELVETLSSAVPTFRTAEELSSHVHHFLAHETVRRSAATLARHLVEPHTFAARAAQLLADLESSVSQQQPIAKGA